MSTKSSSPPPNSQENEILPENEPSPSNDLPETSNPTNDDIEESSPENPNNPTPINKLATFVNESFGEEQTSTELFDQHEEDLNHEQSGNEEEFDRDINEHMTQNLSGDFGDSIYCQKCNVRKVYRNNLCYRCRGSGAPIRSAEYHKQVDEQFVSKCLEVGEKRRVSIKPLTFTEEFLLKEQNAKKARFDPKPRTSLPNFSIPHSAHEQPSNLLTMNGISIKEEPTDEPLSDLHFSMESLSDSKIEEMSGLRGILGRLGRDVTSEHPNDRVRQCCDCHQFKLFYAKSRCKQCYQNYRRRVRNPNFQEPRSSTQLSQTQNGEVCERCGKMGKNYALNKCKNCYQHSVYTRRKSDFTNFRVCQVCKEYKQYCCRGMCHTCFKRLNGQKNRQKRRQTLPIFNGDEPPKKSGRPSATNCVVCNELLQGDACWSSVSIVCKTCHNEGKERYRWCVDCKLLKFHHGRQRCQNCYKKMMSSGRKSNINHSSSTRPQTINGQLSLVDQIVSLYNQSNVNNGVEGEELNQQSSFESFGDQSRPIEEPKTSNKITHCAVCNVFMDSETKHHKNAKVCQTCRANGKERHRWCNECGLLKFHQGRGLCRECYPIFMTKNFKNLTNESEKSNGDHLEIDGWVLKDYCNKLNFRSLKTSTIDNSFDTMPLDNEPTISFYSKRPEQHLPVSSSNSTAQCVVCSASLGMELWNNKNAKVCLKCKSEGKTNYRWCNECGRLSYMASKKVINKITTLNPIEDSPPIQSTQNSPSDNSQKVVEQIVKICNQYNSMANDLSKNSESTHQGQGTSRRKQQKPEKISDALQPIESLQSPKLFETPEEISQDSNSTTCVVCFVPLTNENTQQKREKSCLECRSKGLANHRWCVDCKQLKLCTGRQRCYTCYTIFMCKLKGKEVVGPTKHVIQDVRSRIESSTSSTAPKKTTSNPFENLKVDNPQALIEQIVQMYNQLTGSSEDNDQPKLTVPKSKLRPTQPEAIRPPQISRNSNERPTNCLVCQTSLMFENKNQKVCNQCKAEKKQRFRWCLDCNELKQCVGRNRCSFCYTVFMKNLKLNNGIDSSRAKNIQLNQTWPFDQPSTSRQSEPSQLDQTATSRDLPQFLRQPLIPRGIIQNGNGVNYITVSSASEGEDYDD